MKLSLFFKGHQFRMAGTFEQPAWCGKDLCSMLGIRNHKQALRALPQDEKVGGTVYTPLGGKQTLTFVTEPGLYRLIFMSRKPEAEAFKRWIFHRVLPAIRKHGSFIPERDDHPAELLALPAERRDHFIFWLGFMNEIASVEKRRPKIIELSRRHEIAQATIYRKFKHWSESGGDWRVLDGRTTSLKYRQP